MQILLDSFVLTYVKAICRVKYVMSENITAGIAWYMKRVPIVTKLYEECFVRVWYLDLFCYFYIQTVLVAFLF